MLSVEVIRESAVHNFHDAYVLKIRCALDCFDVPLFHMVGFALGLLLGVCFRLQYALAFPPPCEEFL